MVTVAEIEAYLDTLAPKTMKMEWDNVGLLCGHRDHPVTRVLVALDPFMDAAQEAAQVGAQLLVTHHPLIFHPLHSVSDDTVVGKTILFLVEHGIAAFNAHTNLDVAPGGVNDCLAQKLGLQNIEVLYPQGVDDSGRPLGLLRGGTVKPCALADLIPQVRMALGCPAVRFVNAGKPVRKVAVGGGACAGELRTVACAGYDTFVTADVKYNQFWDAKDLGLNLIDAGHFYTEQPVCAYLAENLRRRFPEVQVDISKNHADCMEFAY